MACAGLPSFPEEIPATVCDQVRGGMAERQITMAAVSGTFNMIHPDPEKRRQGLRRLHVLASAAEALAIAEETDVILAFEPEAANVIDTSVKAANLLAAMRSPRLKVVIDPANLFHRGEIFRMHDILKEAFELLGPHIVLAHAKDV